MNDGQLQIAGPKGHRLLSPNGEIIVPPIFYVVGTYDPVSKLTLAQIKKPDGKVIQGYINEKAVLSL